MNVRFAYSRASFLPLLFLIPIGHCVRVSQQCIRIRSPVSIVIFVRLIFAARFRLDGQLQIPMAQPSMARVDASLAERYVQYAQCALFRHFDLLRLQQRLLILRPADLGAIESLDRALDLNLRTVEDGRRTANLQRNLVLLGVMLNEGRVGARNRRSLIFRCTGLGVAGFLVRRLAARTHRCRSLYLVLLGHDLFALDASLLETSATRSEVEFSIDYFIFHEDVLLQVLTLNICSTRTPPTGRDSRWCCSTVGPVVASSCTYCSVRSLCFLLPLSPRGCTSPRASVSQSRTTWSTV